MSALARWTATEMVSSIRKKLARWRSGRAGREAREVRACAVLKVVLQEKGAASAVLKAALQGKVEASAVRQAVKAALPAARRRAAQACAPKAKARADAVAWECLTRRKPSSAWTPTPTDLSLQRNMPREWKKCVRCSAVVVDRAALVVLGACVPKVALAVLPEALLVKAAASVVLRWKVMLPPRLLLPTSPRNNPAV